MIAKLITCDRTRAGAIATMRTALAVFRVDGINTNAGLHAAIMADRVFGAGGVDTNYLPEFLVRSAKENAA